VDTVKSFEDSLKEYNSDVSTVSSVSSLSKGDVLEINSELKFSDEDVKKLVPKMERTSKRLDKHISKQQDEVERVSAAVSECESELAGMEKRITMDESEIKLLAKLSIRLASQLKNVEPGFGYVREIKERMKDITESIDCLRASISGTFDTIDILSKRREEFQTLNGVLQEKAFETMSK